MGKHRWRVAAAIAALTMTTAGVLAALANDEGPLAEVAGSSYVAMVARDGPLPTPTPTPEPTVHPGPAEQPLGFPVDPRQPVGWVTGEPGKRTIAWDAGPHAETYTREYQPSGDPVAANSGGWNCRTHVAYEGRPAVDWYLPVGTPIYATMAGTARLYVITVTNAFDYYGVSREPYLGDPQDAPLSPFPGPGGGKGVYVEIVNGTFVTESAHLEVGATLAIVPDGAFVGSYSRDTDYASLFAGMRAHTDATLVAEWSVERGELIGYSGDAGYSEAPHLHYTIRRTSGGGLLCPTGETGFADGGWLIQP